jgi:hypothetical protein
MVPEGPVIGLGIRGVPEYVIAHFLRQQVEELRLADGVGHALTAGILEASHKILELGDTHLDVLQVLHLILLANALQLLPQHFKTLRASLINNAIDHTPRLQPVAFGDSVAGFLSIALQAVLDEAP